METIKNFIKKNFTVLVMILTIFIFFKSCSDSRTLAKINKKMETMVTKEEMAKELKISGLEAEKRMIQATDRKMLDVRRQTEIEEELKKLESN
jgi:hypothetical protein